MTRNIEHEAITVILEQEKQRVVQRDQQLLAQELAWVTKQPGFNAISFQSLDAYCSWLSPEHSKVVRWDLLRHYAINQSSPYYPLYKKNSVIAKPFPNDYSNRLLTHSLSWKYWLQAKESGYIRSSPSVSFSSGQAVFKGDILDGMNSMTIFFDRQVLDNVYTLLPYADHEVEWEREVRAYEPIHLGLALNCIPTKQFIPELNHWGQLTCACGKEKITRLEVHYLEDGRLNFEE